MQIPRIDRNKKLLFIAPFDFLRLDCSFDFEMFEAAIRGKKLRNFLFAMLSLKKDFASIAFSWFKIFVRDP